MLLPHRLIDLIVQVPDLKITQALLLYLADFPRDFFEDLTAPFLAGWDRGDFGDELWTAGASCVDYSEGSRLLGAETEEHRLRFF